MSAPPPPPQMVHHMRQAAVNLSAANAQRTLRVPGWSGCWAHRCQCRASRPGPRHLRAAASASAPRRHRHDHGHEPEASTWASCEEKVDLPTPPLPDSTRILCLTAAMRAWTRATSGSGPLGVEAHADWFGHPAHAAARPAVPLAVPGHAAGALSGTSSAIVGARACVRCGRCGR